MDLVRPFKGDDGTGSYLAKFPMPKSIAELTAASAPTPDRGSVEEAADV